MGIFHSYVSLPEGIIYRNICPSAERYVRLRRHRRGLGGGRRCRGATESLQPRRCRGTGMSSQFSGKEINGEQKKVFRTSQFPYVFFLFLNIWGNPEIHGEVKGHQWGSHWEINGCIFDFFWAQDHGADHFGISPTCGTCDWLGVNGYIIRICESIIVPSIFVTLYVYIAGNG